MGGEHFTNNFSMKCIEEKGTTSPRKTSIQGATTAHKVKGGERPIVVKSGKKDEEVLAKVTKEEE